MCGYPQFSFSISITLVKIYISRIIINRGKNTFELVGTVLKQRYLHEVKVKSAYEPSGPLGRSLSWFL